MKIQLVTAIAWLLPLAHTLALPATDTELAKLAPRPDADPFYTIPSDLGALSPGAIIRQREVTPLSGVGDFLSRTTQVLYRTTNAQGEADATVATVWSPMFPDKEAKLLSYQYAEDAVNFNCAPSFAFTNSTSKNGNIAKPEGFLVINFAMLNRWHVVIPDHQGRNSAFIAGNVEGRAVLDGMRAAINLRSLKTTTRVAMYGYSGAAHASTWAATLHEQYAPELNIVGMAVGGTPIDGDSIVKKDNRGPNAPILAAAVLGLANGYPALNATYTAELTEAGKAIATEFRDPNTCTIGGVVQTKYANFDIFSLFKSGQAILDKPEVQAILRPESLLNRVRNSTAPVYQFPSYFYHGAEDDVIPYDVAKEYVAQQCKAGQGADIRFVTIRGAGHVGGAISNILGVTNFLKQAMDLQVPKAACGSDSGAITPNSRVAIDAMGEEFNKKVLEAEEQPEAWNLPGRR